jgi:hypothetical protein
VQETTMNVQDIYILNDNKGFKGEAIPL